MAELEQALADIAAEMAARTDRGAVATYIPQLGKIDPQKFGIAVATNDGRVLVAGDADEAFSIQSISKVFTLTLALGEVGDALWKRVGREPSGNPFNSIVQLEHENGIPRNPFINAGAIVISDIMLAGHQSARDDRRNRTLHPVPGRRRHHCDRPRGRRFRASYRLSQFRARQLHEIVRQSTPSAGTVVGCLFPPVRHRDELSAACDGRTVPCQ